MDFTSAFKSEIFRPLVSLAIPGFLTVSPYIIITGYYIPVVRSFWDEHPSAFVAIVVTCMLAAGLILENIGTFIEDQWDGLLISKDESHLETWRAYLKLELNYEIVWQRYLRILLTWMKFELSMVPALTSLWIGLLWINCLYKIWSVIGFILISIFIFVLICYLLKESYKSARNLARVRKLIVEAIKAKPISKTETESP
ncbi:MAG: hypothetical protein DMF68_10165 [Acidobacteria bacterium]|nr:MAG: hypothetical protein DMF68_10165 [Acidobacteriota bacterium]